MCKSDRNSEVSRVYEPFEDTQPNPGRKTTFVRVIKNFFFIKGPMLYPFFRSFFFVIPDSGGRGEALHKNDPKKSIDLHKTLI